MSTLIRTDSKSNDFQKLVALLDKGLRITDGADFSFFTQFNKLDEIKNVIVAYSCETAVGCGAFKKYSDDTAEIKRMFVKEDFRGKGIAREILTELERWVAENGYLKCILETGDVMLGAINLYQNAGYTRIANYGQYENSTRSVCMTKTL